MSTEQTRWYKAVKNYDITGLNGSVALFTVTGSVKIKLVAICKTGLVGGQNIEVGIVGTTGAIIATTLDTDLDADDIWHDANPDAEIETLDDAEKKYVITDGNDILITSDGAVTSGDLFFVCEWTPIEGGSTVVAA